MRSLTGWLEPPEAIGAAIATPAKRLNSAKKKKHLSFFFCATAISFA
jgi:hypothetical protein